MAPLAPPFLATGAFLETSFFYTFFYTGLSSTCFDADGDLDLDTVGLVAFSTGFLTIFLVTGAFFSTINENTS